MFPKTKQGLLRIFFFIPEGLLFKQSKQLLKLIQTKQIDELVAGTLLPAWQILLSDFLTGHSQPVSENFMKVSYLQNQTKQS